MAKHSRSQLLYTSLGLAVLSLLVAFISLGKAYPEFITPRSGSGYLEGISADGWITSNSSLKLGDLFRTGNVLELKFNPWRPDGVKAQIEVFVCDQKAGEFEVFDESEKIVSLKGNCDPREVTFQVKNPFSAGTHDQRLKGAQLISAKVLSHAHFPLLSVRLIAVTTAAFLILALSVFFLLPIEISIFIRQSVSAFVVLISGVLIWIGDDLDFVQEYSLWLFVFSLVTGALIAKNAARSLSFATTDSHAGGMSSPLQWSIILSLVAFGAGLRWYGIGFGLPANFHPDEVPKVNAIMRMVTNGDLNPHYFLHPTLLIYCTYFLNTVFHFFGMEGSFRETAFLAGRNVSAIAGTLSILWVFLIGRRLFSPVTGLMAAALLTVYPLHVTCSRYMKEDSLLVCFILLCVWATIKAVGDNRRWFLLVAGIFAGLAASTKYTGVLSICVIAAAPWLKSRQIKPDVRFLFATLVAFLIVPAFFIAGTPYSVLSSEEFLGGVQAEQTHMNRGHTVAITSWSQLWMYHFWRSLLPGTTAIAAMVGTAGLGLLLWRRRIEDLYIVAVFLLYYLPAEYVKAKPEPQPERYIMPCLPMLALASAELIRMLWHNHRRVLSPLLFVALFSVPLIRSTELASEIPEDTRIQMGAWMKAHLPHGSVVAMDWQPYEPIINPEFQVKILERSPLPLQLSIQQLKSQGYDYILLSSLWYGRFFTQPDSNVIPRQVFREIFQRLPIVKEFAPEYGTYGFHNPKLTLLSVRPDDVAKLDAELALKKEGKIQKTSNEMTAEFQWSTERPRG